MFSSRQELSWRYLSWRDSSRSDSIEAEFYFFAPIFSTKKRAPRFFEKDVASRVFTYHCNIPQYAPIEELQHTPERVKHVEAPRTSTLSTVASDGPRWVHPDARITILHDSSLLHIRTTLQTVKIDVPITVTLCL